MDVMSVVLRGMMKGVNLFVCSDQFVGVCNLQWHSA